MPSSSGAKWGVLLIAQSRSARRPASGKRRSWLMLVVARRYITLTGLKSLGQQRIDVIQACRRAFGVDKPRLEFDLAILWQVYRAGGAQNARLKIRVNCLHAHALFLRDPPLF